MHSSAPRGRLDAETPAPIWFSVTAPSAAGPLACLLPGGAPRVSASGVLEPPSRRSSSRRMLRWIVVGSKSARLPDGSEHRVELVQVDAEQLGAGAVAG